MFFFFGCDLKWDIFERKIVNLFVFVCFLLFLLFYFIFNGTIGFLNDYDGVWVDNCVVLIPKKMEKLTKLTAPN